MGIIWTSLLLTRLALPLTGAPGAPLPGSNSATSQGKQQGRRRHRLAAKRTGRRLRLLSSAGLVHTVLHRAAALNIEVTGLLST